MREKSTQWWWIRHAPVPDMEGVLYGTQDVACDTTNTRAFKWLANILPNNGIWLTSHLSRTQKTAEAIRQAGLNFSTPIKESKIGEQNFAQGMQMVHYDVIEYLSRPLCLLLITAGLLTLIVGIYKALSYSLNS